MHLMHCSDWIEHEAHSHSHYDIDANRYVATWCVGSQDRTLTNITSEFDVEYNEYLISFLDQFGSVLKAIRLTKAELEMLDVRKVLDKANETVEETNEAL